MTMPWQHILLDLDGTLVNSMEIFYAIDQELLSYLGIALSEADFAAMQMEDGFRVLRRILDERSRLSEPEKAAVFQNILEESTKRLSHHVAWYADVEAFVQESKARSIPLHIVTRSNTQDLENMEHCIAVRQTIPVIVQGEDTREKHKPDPYPLTLAAERLGVAPSACLYIGDHADDLKAAKAAGMPSCIIFRAHVPRILGEQADRHIETLADIFSSSFSQ